MARKNNAFKLNKDFVNLTTGTHAATTWLCVADGSLTVTWDSGGTSVIPMIAGDAVYVEPRHSVAVTSGTFHADNE